jgi:Domain of unknown function (DUF4870)
MGVCAPRWQSPREASTRRIPEARAPMIGSIADRSCACRPRVKCHPRADDGYESAAYVDGVPTGAPQSGRRTKEQFVSRSCPACSARLDQQATTCPHCGADLTADPAIQAAPAATVDESARTTAVAAHLSTFAGLVVPFGSVIGPLAVWLTRRDRDPVHRPGRPGGAELRHHDRHRRRGAAGGGVAAGRHPVPHHRGGGLGGAGLGGGRQGQ